MQEEFEKKIRERMHTFGIQPAPQVWDDIDAALGKKKHRRFFIGWWILLGLIAGAGAILLVDKNNIKNNKINQQPPIFTDTASNNHLAEKPKTIIIQKSIAANRNNNNTSNSNQNSNSKQQNQVNQPIKNLANTANTNRTAATVAGNATLQGKSIFLLKSRLPGIGDKQNTEAVNTQTSFGANPKAAIATNPSGYVAANKPAAINTIGQPNLLNSSADTATALPKTLQDTAVLTAAQPVEPNTQTPPPAAANKSMAAKKSKWYFTFSAGSTQTISGGAFNASSATNALYSSLASPYILNVPAVTALSAYTYNITQPGLGFHVSAGGLYQRQLSPRWQISAGLSLAYLSNTQKTGLAYKSPLSISASNQYTLTSSQIILQSYYQPGTTGIAVNKAWQAEVPVALGYVFNPKSKTKFMFNGGLSLSWMFSSEWLIPDSRYGKLYYSKTVFNSTAVNGQAGPAVEFKNQWRFGLQYQQSFTTLAKNYVTPKLYWQNISMYTAIPLGIKTKHKAAGPNY